MICSRNYKFNNMKKILFFSLITVASFTSCEKEEMKFDIKNDARLAEELRLNPDTIKIDSIDLTLSTSLYRDFMPISEENGRKMACINNLTVSKNASILNQITLKRQYLINGNEIWTASYNKVEKTNNSITGTVINGPKWGPNINVDVVSEFEMNGNIYKILAKSQLITRTD